MKKILLVLLPVLCLPALAADRPLEPAAPGQLQVHIAVSDSPGFIEDWAKNSAGKKILIPRIKEIELGHTAYVAFIVTGYTPGAARSVDLEVDVSILQRDGTVFFEQESFAALKDVTAPPRGFLMADPTLEMDLQPDDLPGTYAITAVVRDRISGKKAKSGFALLALEPEAAEEEKEEEEGPPPEKQPPPK